MNRRGFLTLGATFLAAPAILRVTTLDVLPQYETVATYAWSGRMIGLSDVSGWTWSMTGSTRAATYQEADAQLKWSKHRSSLSDVSYESLGRRDDSRELTTRRRERIVF